MTNLFQARQAGACPACGASSTDSESFGTGLEAKAGDETFVQPDYLVRVCGICGLLYKTVTLSAQEFDLYYSAVDFTKWEIVGFYPTERLSHKILSQLPVRAAVLDFGCSSGRLLAPFTNKLDCYGIEKNREAAAVALSKGITILTMDSIHERGRFLDCILLMDVFEHLLTPVDLLRSLKGALKPGGSLVIVTGNSDFPICRNDPANFWYMRTVEHVCMLNERHAKYLENHLKMKLVNWISCSHYDSSISERLAQFVRYYVYRRFIKGGSFSRIVISKIPLLNRVKNWTLGPAVTLGRDHVVAVFQI